MNNEKLVCIKQNIPELNTDNCIQFPEELLHLADLNQKLNEALEKAEADVEQLDKEYMDFKRYMVDYRGEIDPHEMFQNELELKKMDHTGVFAVGIRDKLVRQKDSPYFSRIDFRERDSGEIIKHYIGRFSFSCKNELLVFDWRAPVASMYYNYELGPAGFDAPIGRIEGELTRKRQFKINNGKLVYALESSVSIQDDILQQELSHTSDEKMKSIITTIQKEQNQIIRNEKSETMIIQGVAGSGKTSIALHRIAFLLYRFKNRLSAKNITIISPNRVFGDYIANVLPELGEEPIYELSFADVAQVQLEDVINFEYDRDPLETKNPLWAERVRFKSTLDFVKLMDVYIEQMPDQIFVPVDYTYGQFSVTAEMIGARYRAYGTYPVTWRLKMMAEDIYDRFDTDNFMDQDIPKAKTIQKSLYKMLTVKNTLSLYKEFYSQLDMHEMFHMPAKSTLEWSDVYPYLYLKAAFEGLQESIVIKHLIIDEMQDYTPIQYAVINLLFQCQKTILGDFGQFINPNHLHTLEDIKQLYSKAEIVKLTKSYRSTYEIISFARRIQSVEDLEPIERHGAAPEVIACGDEQEELDYIKEEIDRFRSSGYASLGIIVKTNKVAQYFYNQLFTYYKMNLISPDSTDFKNGVSVTSIQMSKGLEFDKVIIPCADSSTYATDYDRSLLYIGCTRAMHELTILHIGEASHLIPR